MEGNKSYPIMCEEEVMSQKAHGTTEKPVQQNLRYGCDVSKADQICCYNRHYAEHSGYAWTAAINWVEQCRSLKEGDTITYYDSVTGKPLFEAPKGRTMEEFLNESRAHGWPSFRDEEVIWDDMRCLKNGEAVSTAGTHLGHNLPDSKGNRYCINLVSVAGNPVEN